MAVGVAEALKACGVEMRCDDGQIFDGMAAAFAPRTNNALPPALNKLPHQAPPMYFALIDVGIAIATAINAIDNFAAVTAWQIDSQFLVVDLLHMRQQLFAAKLRLAPAPHEISRPDDS